MKLRTVAILTLVLALAAVKFCVFLENYAEATREARIRALEERTAVLRDMPECPESVGTYSCMTYEAE